jgi:fructose-bisphosphate aldolase class II
LILSALPAEPKASKRAAEIHARIPDTHLVMHGSSSVPQDWLEMRAWISLIRSIRNTSPVGSAVNLYAPCEVPIAIASAVNEIVEGIKHGVRKVNIDTDLRMASTGAVRKHLIEHI